MIEIRRLKPDELTVAKRLIYRVAHEIFNEPLPLEESIAFYESRGELKDMDNIEQSYFENGGIFLVMTNENEIIGTGAIRFLEDGICEIKRLWLLPEYRGQELGYRMMTELLSIARQKGYQKARLETDPVFQQRALAFYKRLGFYEIPRYDDSPDDIALELIL